MEVKAITTLSKQFVSNQIIDSYVFFSLQVSEPPQFVKQFYIVVAKPESEGKNQVCNKTKQASLQMGHMGALLSL